MKKIVFPKVWGVAMLNKATGDFKLVDSLPIIFYRKIAKGIAVQLNNFLGMRGTFVPVEITIKLPRRIVS